MKNQRDAVFLATPVDGIAHLPKSPGVYCIVNRANGKRYVGLATKSVYQRCVQHRSDLRRGVAANLPMRRDALVHGADVFFFFAMRIDGIAAAGTEQLDNIELWFAVQLGTHDERLGYNLEVGHNRTRAARFRDRERKLMRRSSGKYELIPGVNIGDQIQPELLTSWVPGG
jgi:hypothetical protein